MQVSPWQHCSAASPPQCLRWWRWSSGPMKPRLVHCGCHAEPPHWDTVKVLLNVCQMEIVKLNQIQCWNFLICQSNKQKNASPNTHTCTHTHTQQKQLNSLWLFSIIKTKQHEEQKTELPCHFIFLSVKQNCRARHEQFKKKITQQQATNSQTFCLSLKARRSWVPTWTHCCHSRLPLHIDRCPGSAASLHQRCGSGDRRTPCSFLGLSTTAFNAETTWLGREGESGGEVGGKWEREHEGKLEGKYEGKW